MDVIERPRHVHGVTTPEEFTKAAAARLERVRVARPWLTIGYVHATPSAPRIGPVVEHGRWKIACAHCQNWPAYDPDWQLAVCFECGAKYEDLAAGGDVTTIERELLAIADQTKRNWPAEAAV